ncbi:hypothetical protein GCM10010052_19930 [Paenarthrobacter histidinolovorans]|nr:hypothetical protein GCM10010052_19930 [Paenarthrobacter histidinolovorans]
MENVRRAAWELVRTERMTMDDLWSAFYRLGGKAGKIELEAYIYGLIPVSSTDKQLLAPALTIITRAHRATDGAPW